MDHKEIQDRIQKAKEQNLTVLDLSAGSYSYPIFLTKIPSEVFELTQLEILNLNGHEIKEIPEGINRLSNLKELHIFWSSLSLTQISYLLSVLPHLTYLGIRWCNSYEQLLNTLTNIQQLGIDLTYNELTTIPDSITKLVNLTELNLTDNKLATIPDSITKLGNLTSLDLSSNQLTTIPDSITKLVNLTSLDLSSNQLTTIPDSITKLVNLTFLYLDNNPLENPPLEVCDRGIEAIREYFRQLKEEGEDTLYEAKLLIVGEGEAGKTTLARRIEDPNCPLPDLNETTEGIDIKTWHFTLENGKNFQVNIWDFGGQEIYHATHQFFLTKRSLYFLVVDSRKDNPNLPYWFHVIELLSDNSPLVIIKNEKYDYTVNISENQLKGRFENFKDSIKCNFIDNRGLDRIKDSIAYYMKELPHIGGTLPKTWIRVRESLEQDERNHITLSEYVEICKENGFKQQKDALQLSEYLHDIGVILHFQDDITSPLYKTVIIRPTWATESVYKVLRSEKFKQNLGRFTDGDLEDIWQDDEYFSMRGELLDLMMKFKLCYQLPNEKSTYIAPQLLDYNEPEYEWNSDDNIILRYRYDFMPKGILTRFIVEMHRFILEPFVWLTGVLLQREETRANIVETYDQREIIIRLSGANKRGFLEVITDQFDRIHESYNRLKVDKLIPCNCPECKDSQQPGFHVLEYVKKALSKGKTTVECQESCNPTNIFNLIGDNFSVNSLFPSPDENNPEAKKLWREKLSSLQVYDAQVLPFA
jgi:Leucine-rich repeat (LRR) protein